MVLEALSATAKTLPPLSVINPSTILRATLPKDAVVSERREFQDPALELRSRRAVAVNCSKKVTAAAGIEPESAAALSSGVGHSCEGARNAIADDHTSHLAGPGICHHNRVASDGRSVNTEAAVAKIARS
jgi:hypothetical protein